MRQHDRSGMAADGLLLCLALVAAGACQRDPDGSRIAYVPDCPRDSISIVVGSDTTRDIPVASEIDEIPEYHDCQRFRLPPDTLGQLVAIWAATDLARYFINSDLDTVSSPGLGSGSGVTRATPVAEIHNFDRTEYAPLHIKHGFSCLYLIPNPGEAAGWEARMVSLGPLATPCRDPQDAATLGGAVLAVHAQTLPAGLAARDVAPVARWDYDSVNARQYIGIRCGAQWCEIGDKRLASSPTYPLDPGSSNARVREISARLLALGGSGPDAARLRQRVIAIKGWYDEQRLSVAGGAGLTLSPAFGTIIPDPGLGAAGEDDYGGRWVSSASVFVTAPYKGKLEFQQGMTAVAFCRGPACGVTAPLGCPSTVDPASDSQWWARFQNPDGTTTDRCVTRMTHSVIPADAARWRWSERDEQLWVRCTVGCCTVN